MGIFFAFQEAAKVKRHVHASGVGPREMDHRSSDRNQDEENGEGSGNQTSAGFLPAEGNVKSGLYAKQKHDHLCLTYNNQLLVIFMLVSSQLCPQVYNPWHTKNGIATLDMGIHIYFYLCFLNLFSFLNNFLSIIESVFAC